MLGRIIDYVEFCLVEFFVAASGLTLSASVAETSPRSAETVLVATILLLLIVLIQFFRRQRAAR
jgi:hypothetical protein